MLDLNLFEADRQDSSTALDDFTMVLHNPNNWHWVNKDVSAWAKDWFNENLSKVEAEDGDVKAKVDKVQSMDGDVDVSQRKGKVITIFDVKLVLQYSGKTRGMLSVLLQVTDRQAPPPVRMMSLAQSLCPRSPMTRKKTSTWYVTSPAPTSSVVRRIKPLSPS